MGIGKGNSGKMYSMDDLAGTLYERKRKIKESNKVQDYYHYAYKCPYFSQVTKYKLVCERGCSVIFSDKAEAKRYLKAYCCKDYMACTIAKMLNNYWEGEAE